MLSLGRAEALELVQGNVEELSVLLTGLVVLLELLYEGEAL